MPFSMVLDGIVNFFRDHLLITLALASVLLYLLFQKPKNFSSYRIPRLALHRNTLSDNNDVFRTYDDLEINRESLYRLTCF
jgi:hypothetical protein